MTCKALRKVPDTERAQKVLAILIRSSTMFLPLPAVISLAIKRLNLNVSGMVSLRIGSLWD